MNRVSLLKWYIESGVDEAICDEAQDCFAAPAPVAPPATAPVLAVPPRSAPAVSLMGAAPRTATLQARQTADQCNNLAELEQAVRDFDGCAIKKTATNTVFCDGNPAAKIMLIGEAPGSTEDQKGIPFCGVSGQLLDKMLQSISITRENAYITNTVFWRPPGNRPPNAEEIDICRPFVEKHIALINPSLLILVGGIATSAVLGKEMGISKLRGKSYSYNNQYLGHEIPVAVTYHPSYLLRTPAQKRLAWHDLLHIKSLLDNLL